MNLKPELIQFPGKVPYYSQLASEELAEKIFDQEFNPTHDPRWREYGAATPEEYAYWASRACGPAGVKMVVEAFGGPVRTMMAWINQGVACNGYQISAYEQGQTTEVGWDHRVLAKLIQDAGYNAYAQEIKPGKIVDCLKMGSLLIASVSYEIGTTLPVSRRGGHLVVVNGVERIGKSIDTYIVHNPSGRTETLRQNARIDAARFEAAYSGRGIIAMV